ncbi:MAG: TauD/TfdA family dioxygenase, partial [Acidimicrobiaceae bacterium]|nr:TauD/TfdA family dioxygenase [Acidimicrobiaceae bacterium]
MESTVASAAARPRSVRAVLLIGRSSRVSTDVRWDLGRRCGMARGSLRPSEYGVLYTLSRAGIRGACMTSTIDSTEALAGQDNTSGGVQVRKATGSVGAIVTGVDLNEDFDEATGTIIREALHENCVLVVRGQFLTPDAHMRVARLWGEPFLPHYYRANSVEGYPHIAVIPNFGKEKTPSEGWHVDGSHFRVPPTVSIAVGRTIPAVGGDTMFSNQYNAYDRLSDGMKEFLEGRRARFVGTRPVGAVRHMDRISDLLPDDQKEEVAHYH